MRKNFNFTLFDRLPFGRGMAFGLIITAALLAFELFNYSTTDFALHDLLGDLSFIGVRWSTILAIAFCGIDFAGIARIFTPEQGTDEPAEIWYLFGAWLLAATMNAMLTWWGISIAVLNHETLGNAVIERSILLKAVPIFVAVLVWLSRVLLIGTFSIAGENIFTQNSRSTSTRKSSTLRRPKPQKPYQRPTQQPIQQQPARAFRPSPKNKPQDQSQWGYNNQPSEPTYHPVGFSGEGEKRQTRY
jgi:hypothetical protein